MHEAASAVLSSDGRLRDGSSSLDDAVDRELLVRDAAAECRHTLRAMQMDGVEEGSARTVSLEVERSSSLAKPRISR